MTTELITGKAGTPHVSSDDIGVMQAGIIGYDTYLLKNNNGTYPAITLKDSNHATIPVMQLIVEGRYVRVTSAETATIDSGVSGQKRNDLICLKYTRDTSNIETASIVVLKGTNTTGTPTDPTVPAGSIINASATAYARLARVSINGITPATPIMLTTQLTGMGDSQTQPRIYTGQKNITFTSVSANMLSDGEYTAIVGRSYTGADVVVLTSISTGIGIPLGSIYDIPTRQVRAVQLYNQSNVTVDVRYAIIAHG